MGLRTEEGFVSSVCLPFLHANQNSDGGWGFHPGSESRVEPTSWAVLALGEPGPPHKARQAGFRFLRKMQLPDGSWPSSATQTVGCWATSLASWALLTDPESEAAVAAGLRWICQDWPRGVNFLQRMIRKAARRKKVSLQNDLLRGWGWTPGTASWVEPTAFALLALDRAAKELVPPEAGRRRELAKAMLFDRMCPGGGWNCGNPVVYGVPGDPLVEPTVWALLALRDEANRPEHRMSLAWLEKIVSEVLGAGSLALARICLETYGRRWPTNAPDVRDLYPRNEFLESVSVMAWTCLALSPRRGWPKAEAEGAN
jgi:hypothetical protein